MARYEFTDLQVKSLRVLIMDASIKGSAAHVIVELLASLDSPVGKRIKDGLRSEHNDRKKHRKVKP